MCDASLRVQQALDAIVIACDQLGECIAMAHDSSKLQESGILDPFLTLWRFRWEAGLHGGEVEGAEPKRREAVAACEHETNSDGAEKAVVS